MPKGFTSLSAERLLKIKHGIDYDDYDDTNEHCSDAERGPDSGPLYDHGITIGSDNYRNVESAVSFVKQHFGLDSAEYGSVDVYQLGVHVVNCAKHIIPNTDIDKGARRRGMSVYGGQEGKTMQMLPARTREMLSLKPSKIRDVLSIVTNVKIDANGITFSDVKIEQAQMITCVQLTYMTAQKIMNGIQVPSLKLLVDIYNSQSDQPLQETLQLLYKIAFHMRLNRLNSDVAYSYNLNDPDKLDCWQAHMLIKELMIWANSIVAERLHNYYPDTALLIRQRQPNEEKLFAFINEQKKTLSLSLAMSYLVNDYQLECSDEMSFILTTSVLHQIREAVTSKNMVRLASILSSDCCHPQTAAAYAKLRSHIPLAEYCSTGTDKDEHYYRHYSLRLDTYTHFTSPLNRYIDIEVQRMLVTLPGVSKVNGPPKEFSPKEHQRLCRHINNRTSNANQFQQSLNTVELAVKFSSSSEVYEAYIADNSEGSIELWFPQLELKYLPKKVRKIPLKFLGSYDIANVKEKDYILTPTNKKQKFHWNVQMTSLGADQGKFLLNLPRLSVYKEDDTVGNLADKIADIDMLIAVESDPHSFTLSTLKYKATRTAPTSTVLSLDQWKQALNFVKEPSVSKMRELEEVFSKLLPVSSMQNHTVDQELSSPFISVHYQMSFKPNDIVQVWMARSMRVTYCPNNTND